MDVKETEDVQLLYFDPPQTYLTPHVLRSFLNSLEFQREVFGWQPYDRTTVLLKDFSDYGNAAARSSPNNALVIDVAPLSRAFETFTASERVYSLMNHELVHVATMDVHNSRDRFWRGVFAGKPMPDGKHPESILYNYLTTPRVNVPRWYLEGSAVFVETWMAGGLGRAQGAYDEMVFRAMVRDDAHFYSALGLVSEGTKVDFQGGVNAYLYGTRFFNYLAYTYGPDAVVEWLSRAEDSEAYYARQFEKVFGRPLTESWQDWIVFEKAFQAENLTKIREYPLTSTQALSPRAVGSISRAFYNAENDTLLAGFRYPGKVAHIGRMDLSSGAIEDFVDIKGPMLYKVTSLAYDPDANMAFYTTDNYVFRDVIGLDLNTGKTTPLIKDGRIGDLVLNPKDKALWGVRHLNGYPTIVRIPAPYTGWNQVHTFPYGGDVYDLDISPDGTLLVGTVGRASGAQELHMWRLDDLLAGVIQPVQTFAPGGAIPEGAAFSPDGKYIFGSNYFTGVSNIFRMEVATGDIEYVSNAQTGFFRPIPLPNGQLIVFEYTGQGFTPVKIDPVPLTDVSAISFLGTEVIKKHPKLKDWAVGSPRQIKLADHNVKEREYVPLKEIELGSAFPVIEGYKDGAAIGYHFNFEDIMQFNQLDVTLSYSLNGDARGDEKFHADIVFQGINWHARYWHNDADFYDLFGPTKRARKGDAFNIGYKKSLIYDTPKQLDVTVDLTYLTGLDTLPGNQNVAFNLDEITNLSLGVNYKNTRTSLGGVDHEKGLRWHLGASVDQAGGDTVRKLHGGIDGGFALPLDNSSLWGYASAGTASGDAANPLSRYYFGGFKNNYIDDRSVKRYRQYHTFPGFEIDEIPAQNFARLIGEWNLPPIRFEEIGTPELYLSSVRPALFAGALRAENDGFAARDVFMLGGQVDWSFTLAHRLPMTLSVGYARGFEDGRDDSDEVLFSLKIM